MKSDGFRFGDKYCQHYLTCTLDPCNGYSACPYGWEKALFVPLAKRWYIEFRPAGAVIDKNGVARQSPWNASTCRPGRPVIIANGYQKRGRISAIVESFAELPDAGTSTEAFDAIYPGHRARGGLVAAIKFREIKP